MASCLPDKSHLILHGHQDNHSEDQIETMMPLLTSPHWFLSIYEQMQTLAWSAITHELAPEAALQHLLSPPPHASQYFSPFQTLGHIRKVLCVSPLHNLSPLPGVISFSM